MQAKFGLILYMQLIDRLNQFRHFLFAILLIAGFSNTSFAQDWDVNFEADITSFCETGGNATFTNTTTGDTSGAIVWSWSFGNTNVSSQSNPEASYSAVGQYEVVLTGCKGAICDEERKTAYIIVHEDPEANFSVDTTVACYPVDIDFTDLTVANDGAIVSYVWDFGDGTGLNNGTGSNTKTYISAGNRQPNLTVTDEYGCSSFYPTPGKDIIIEVRDQPVAKWTHAQDSSICDSNLNVVFNNIAEGDGDLVYNWDFGDGTTAVVAGSNATSSHSFSGFKDYDITLVITSDGKACYDSLTKVDDVKLRDDTISFFTSNGTLNHCPGQITLQIQSNNEINSVVWDSPEIAASQKTKQSPIMYYYDTPNLEIGLTVMNEICTTKVTDSLIIQALVADFEADDRNTCLIPHTINFTDLSIGTNIVRYDWNFGEGGGAIDSVSDPNWNYTRQDTFDVSLTIEDANGCVSTITKEDYVLLMPITVKAHSLDSLGCKEDTVNYRMYYTPDSIPITNIEWDFDNGTVVNNTDLTLQYVYPSFGIYYPQITVTNAEGCELTYEDTIMKGDTPVIVVDPSVDFGDTICASQSVIYNNTSVNKELITYSWSFSDGHYIKSATSPGYAFRNVGWSSVSIQANHNECYSSTSIDSFTFVLGSVSLFALQDPDCSDGLAVTPINGSIDADADSYIWYWGDGDTSHGFNRTHTYAGPGNYDISLVNANDTNQCQDSSVLEWKVRNPFSSFTSDIDTACVGTNITFTSQDSDQNERWKWWIVNNKSNTTTFKPVAADSMPGGYFQTGQMDYTFNQVGHYTIIGAVGNSETGCYDTMTIDSMILIADIYPGFEADTNFGCKPLTVTFTDTSTADLPIAQLQWVWNDNDKTIDTVLGAGGSIVFTYQDEKTYSPLLTVIDSIGCSESASDEQIIVTWPNPAFATDEPETCYRDTVELFFTGSMHGPGDSLFWHLDDGSPVDTFAGKNDTVFHIYTRGADYNVTLVAIDSNGCKDSITQIVNIQEPVAEFYLNENDTNFRFCNPLAIQLHGDSSTADITTFTWDFGDGSVTTIPRNIADSASRSYIRSGYFDVTLIGESDLGCLDTVTIDSFIQINGPVVRLILDTLEGCEGIEIEFSFESNDNISTYQWDFGDGTVTPFDTSQKVVNYTYNTAGMYAPAFIVFDTLDASDQENCDYRIPYDNPIYVHGMSVNFGITGDQGCTPFDISFSNAITFDASTYDSIGTGIASLFWQFDVEGESAREDTSSIANPTHTFDTSGDYSVKLIVLDSMGCADSFVYNDTIHAYGSYSRAELDTFTGCSPLTVQFTNRSESDGSINSFLWIFGDDSTSSDSSVSHTYTLDQNEHLDSFTVQLITQDDNGCGDTLVWDDSVHITFPRIQFYPVDSFICEGDTVFFQNQTNASGPSYNWNFGNGDTSILENPEAYYVNDGLYTVSLSVIDTNGCSDVLTKTDYIDYQIPVASFENEAMYKYCPDTTVTFIDSSHRSDIISEWIWFYGDESIDTIRDGSNPSHTYTTAQTFDVRLKVVTTGGCVDDTTKNDLLRIDGPYAVYASADTLGCRYLPINFAISTDSSNVATYKWVFGDGDESEWGDGDVTHVYDSSGVYYPYLRINDGLICTLNVGGIDSVEIESVTADFENDIDTACLDQEFEFINSSLFSNPTANNLWKFNFGDGKATSYSSANDTITHTFSFAGDFDVTMYVRSGSAVKCKDTISYTIHVDSLPLITMHPNDTFCRGDTLYFENQSLGTYSWLPNTNISSVDSLNPSVWPTTNTMYYLTVSDNNGCISNDSVLVNITGMSNDSMLALQTDWGHSIDTGGCIPFTYQFTPEQDYSGSVNGWHWIYGDGFHETTGGSVSYIYDERGTYTQSTIFTHGDNDHCLDTLIKSVTIDTMPVIQSIRTDSTICYDDTLTLFATGQGQGQWFPSNSVENPDSHTTIAYPLDTQTYTFRLTTAGGCFVDTTMFVDIIFWQELIGLEAFPSIDTTIAEGTKEVQFKTSMTRPNLEYSWTPQENLSCYDCSNPIFTGDSAASYKLEVQDETGCIVVTDYVKLHFKYMFSSDLPDAFSPGTTPGVNDTLYIRGWGIDEILEFRIYNRWGELLWENTSGDPNEGWDGKFNDEYVPPGTYVITARTRSIDDENGVQHDSEPIYRNLLIVR